MAWLQPKKFLLPILLTTIETQKVYSHDVRVVAKDVDHRRRFSVPLGIDTPDGSVFGGISSLAYDEDRDVYYALSNDIQGFHIVPTRSPAQSTPAHHVRRVQDQNEIQSTQQTQPSLITFDKDGSSQASFFEGTEGNETTLQTERVATRQLQDTSEPMSNPTNSLTLNPTSPPKLSPTAPPTLNPTNLPMLTPTNSPTLNPTNLPTLTPTNLPTLTPTNLPTLTPTNLPTLTPTNLPTLTPTNPQTKNPTTPPTKTPTTPPTLSPTNAPTENLTNAPTENPTNTPTRDPTNTPTENPSTSDPTGVPSSTPTELPTTGRTTAPTFAPTAVPTPRPSHFPTSSPSTGPTPQPSMSASPTNSPSARPVCGQKRQHVPSTKAPFSLTSEQPSASPTFSEFCSEAPSVALPVTPGPTLKTSDPTSSPSSSPSIIWSSFPSISSYPSSTPSSGPTLSNSPSVDPSSSNRVPDIVTDTQYAFDIPGESSRGTPNSPSTSPSSNPSDSASFSPTTSARATESPSAIPSQLGFTSFNLEAPTNDPSVDPSISNIPPASTTMRPSSRPLARPSADPSSSEVPSTSKPISEGPPERPAASPTQFGFVSFTSTAPTNGPSEDLSISNIPSASPTTRPSVYPSSSDAPSVSTQLSAIPSENPSSNSSQSEFVAFSKATTPKSAQPSSSPMPSISTLPSLRPSSLPSEIPSTIPSGHPSNMPSLSPSNMPSVSFNPSQSPSLSESPTLSLIPSSRPSISNNPTTSTSPSTTPSSIPSAHPSNVPSIIPSSNPSYFAYPPRFYTLKISGSSFKIIQVTYLKDYNGTIFEAGVFGPKAIAYHDDHLYIAHDQGSEFGPGLWEYNVHGERKKSFSIPSFYRFRGGRGFKSLAVSRDGDRLWAATRTGLVDDESDQIRLTEFDTDSRDADKQYVYEKGNDLVSLVVLDDNGSFLALESDGDLFYVLCHEALNVKDIHYLDGEKPDLVKKTKLRDMGGRKLEGMAVDFDGRKSSSDDDDYFIVFLGDNDFVDDTSIVTGYLDIDDSIGIAEPEEETSAETGHKFANDPAIWVDHDDPEDSLIIGTLLDGGLAVYNLHGSRLIRFYGHFVSIDIIYAFKLESGELIDVAVVTEGDDERLSVWQIRSTYPYMRDITSGTIETGGDADDVAGYVSPFTGKVYAFVARNSDDIIQIELYDDGNGKIGGYMFGSRVIDVGSTVAGVVVDRETGYLYVAVKNHEVIIKYDAEPDGPDGDEYHTVAYEDELEDNTLRGLTMYYNGYLDGYLIVSLEDDSTFAVYERNGDNDFVGRFTIGKGDDIDRTDATKGITVTNINLGPDFECGAFVAQDNNNGRDSLDEDRTNFKLVPFDEVSDALSDELEIDTTSWGPHRFNLAIWIDVLSQEVYTEMYDGHISGRDAEELLDYLAQAAAYTYPPASRLRQMMEPYYPLRDLEKRDEYDDQHRRRQRRLSSARRESCSAESSSSSWDSRKGDYGRAAMSLQLFRNLLRALRNNFNRLSELPPSTYSRWMNCSASIEEQIPADLEYDN